MTARKGDVGGGGGDRVIRLDFEDVDRAGKFVLTDEIDFIFAFAIPPAAHARVGRFADEFPAEVTFKGKPGKGREVSLNERLKRILAIQLDPAAVLVEESKPEAQKGVLEGIVRVAGFFAVEDRDNAADDAVIVFESGKVGSDVESDGIRQVAERVLAGGDFRKNGEEDTVLGAELLGQENLAFVNEGRAFAENLVNHRPAVAGVGIHEKLHITGDTTGQHPERPKIFER